MSLFVIPVCWSSQIPTSAFLSLERIKRSSVCSSVTSLDHHFCGKKRDNHSLYLEHVPLPGGLKETLWSGRDQGLWQMVVFEWGAANTFYTGRDTSSLANRCPDMQHKFNNFPAWALACVAQSDSSFPQQSSFHSTKDENTSHLGQSHHGAPPWAPNRKRNGNTSVGAEVTRLSNTCMYKSGEFPMLWVQQS